ncbi:MAG: hypothetical protein ABI767_06750 [Rhodanobacter sp.]
MGLAHTLIPGQTVRLLTHQRPTPLLELLTLRGLEPEVFNLSGDDVCVQIRRPMRDGQTSR